MVYRMFVALALTVFVFPFVAMFALKGVYPDVHFALDRQTWLQGLFPIALGWVIFLLPGLIPGLTDRYFSWIARVTGFTALGTSIRRGLGRIRTTCLVLASAARSAASKLPKAAAARRANGALAPAPPATHGDQSASDNEEVIVSETGSPKASATASIRTGIRAAMGRASSLMRDRSNHIEAAKQHIRGFSERVASLTAEERRLEAELNAYTLEAFAHLKAVAKLAAAGLELDATDAEFVDKVLAAVPEPMMPGQDLLPDHGRLVYPENERSDLIAAAGRVQLLIEDEDFEQAAGGNIERGLKIARAIMSSADQSRLQKLGFLEDDPFIGLPAARQAG